MAVCRKDTPFSIPIPFYQQHYDFTCGPACLMMAMIYLDYGLHLVKGLEIDTWREADLLAVLGQAVMVWLILQPFVDFLRQ